MNLAAHRLELRLHQAVETGELALWDLRPELETVHYSPAWKQRLGFPDPDSPDSTHFWRCRVHPEDLAPMVERMREHIRGAVPTYEARFRLRSNGSGYRLVHSRGRLIERGPEGRPLRLVGTMIDLTERPCTPAGGLPTGPRGAMTGSPISTPVHRLLGDVLAAPERERVLALIDDLLLASLDQVAGLQATALGDQPADGRGGASR